jgi:hypothetical protein
VVKVLVTIEPRSYREAIGYAIRGCRPNVEAARLGPHLAIRGPLGHTPPSKEGFAWVELRLSDACQEATVCVGGERTELLDPELDDLLAAVGRAEAMVGAGSPPRGC